MISISASEIRESVKTLEHEATLDNLDAIAKLSELLRYGAPGLPRDEDRAFELVKANQHHDVCMMLYQSYFLVSGHEKCENVVSFLRTQLENQLAVAYLGRHFFESDPNFFSDGYEMVQRAADTGIAVAQHSLAIFLMNQSGNIPNFVRGFEMLLRAVRQGHPVSIAEYGMILCNEKGHLKDPLTGQQMLRIAAEAGNRRAQSFFSSNIEC